MKTKKASKTCFFLWYMCKLFEKRDFSLLQKRKTLQNVSISSKRRFKTCVWFVNVKQIQNYHLPNCFWHNNWKNQKYCCGGGILLESVVFFQKLQIEKFENLTFYAYVWKRIQSVIDIVWMWLKVRWKGQGLGYVTTKKFDSRGGWNFLSGQNFRWVWSEN